MRRLIKPDSYYSFYSGERLPRRAACQTPLTADQALGVWAVGEWLLRVGSRPDDGETLGDYTLIDLRAIWRFLPQWLLEAKLLNAFDRRVEPVRDYQRLGRQIWLGLCFNGHGSR